MFIQNASNLYSLSQQKAFKMKQIEELEEILNDFFYFFENNENPTIVNDIMNSFVKPFYEVC